MWLEASADVFDQVGMAKDAHQGGFAHNFLSIKRYVVGAKHLDGNISSMIKCSIILSKIKNIKMNVITPT